MKTSSIIEKSLNKSFQILYTFLGVPNMFTLYNVCSAHQGMFSSLRVFSTSGATMSTLGATMSTSGATMSTSGGG